MNEPNQEFNPDEIINEFKEKFSWAKKGDGSVEARQIPTKMPLRVLIALLITAVASAIAYYIVLPPFNIHSTDMYVFLGGVVLIFVASLFLTCGALFHPEYKEYAKSKSKIPVIIIGVVVLAMGIGYLAGAPFFRAKSYTKLLPVETSDFSEDFSQISFSDVPRLDADSAKQLADNRLNELSQYVSQFLVAETSTQSNYKNTAVRVAPLVYGDVFKWLNNTKNGLPAYMIIDMVKQDVKVVELEKGIRYSPSEYFNRKLMRHLRFQFPTAIFDTSNFEINDEGHPYWVTASLTKKIGLFGGTDVVGAILTDAVTGESKYYDIADVPNWVDKVYNDELIIEQYNYYGRFQNGFINSLIGQKEVKITSAGNGYIAMEDDVWLYTGITSASSDESNVGFILTNQRTKETRYYENGGATETGAKSSAAGAVQNYGYVPSFPILLSIDGEPTYFMSLKAKDNLVKQFAMVNLKQRTIVGIGTNPEECVDNYKSLLKSNGINTETTNESGTKEESVATSITGAVTDIRTAVKSGNTYYYFLVDGKYYVISADKCEEAVILNVGDVVKVDFMTTDNAMVPATTVTKAK